MSKLISEVTPYAPNGTASDYGLRASAVQYGTCSTAMTTSAKVVTCATFTADYLVEGSIIAVKFTAANSSNVNNEADPVDFTLNVNNTGAKPIKYIYQGALNSLPAKGFLKQNRIYLFYYDGTNWVAVVSNDTDTIPVDIDVSGGTTELEWGETQTIVNINGTDIKLKMPENPDTNTTYTVTTTGSGNAVTSVTLSGTTITASKDATYNNYIHPAHTSQELGLYKIEVNNLGHVVSTTTASISDLPHNHDDVYLKLTGGTLTGTLTLSSAAATDSPALVFQRGTLSDNYNDWRLIDSGGYLHFQERGNGSSSWTDRVTMTTNGTITASTFSGTATYATKASQDGSGNDIEATYATKSELSGYATSPHSHGNITTSGYMTTSATISNGDRLVITDSSNSHKMVTSTISFDGSTATKALTQKGTWETFNNYTHPSYTSQEQGFYKVSVDTKGHVDSVATVSKADITALGIPGENTNTTYTFTVSGNGSALSGITITDTTITFNKNYSHPTYTSQEKKLYKVSVDTMGHIDSVTTVSKADITGLGIPGQDTTYSITTTGTGNAVTAVGLSGTTITVTKGATYNNYSHPTYTSQEQKLYKVGVDTTGHVNSTATVTKGDITGLGIPGQDTTYTFTKSGTGNALTGISVSGTTITFNSANYNNYSHPTYTSQESGLYKVTIDTTGHVSSTTTVSKADITGLGVPGENTTYTITTTGTGNAVTAVGLSGTTITVTKGATYNNYSHPTYTSQELGFYKIGVDGTGHVSSTSAITDKDFKTTWYGTCNTASSTTAKAATCTDYVLRSGTIVGILFTTSNTAATPTLNVNSTGAKTIYIGAGTTNTTTNVLRWSANTMIYFMYDGTYYRYITSAAAAGVDQPRGANTWYGTSNTTATTTAKVSTINNYVLEKGSLVTVNFSTANTVTNAAITLNINSTGAKIIYYHNAATSSTNQLLWDANTTMTFMYDGTGYALLSRIKLGISDLPTGTTSTTVALGNHNHDGVYATATHTHDYAASSHTHTTTISQTGTSQIDLVANTVYTLTAGGTTVVFKTPADNNTTYTPATSVTAVDTSSATGTSTNYARQDHVHNITLATGDNNGQVKIAGTNVSVKGLGTAAYTASTAYATSGHTHTLTIAADSGTNAITLAHGTKYKLTAGGSTLIFTTPSDNNTDVNVRQQLYAQNYNLPLLMAYQTNTNTTTNVDNIAFRNNSIYANPSTGMVAATTYRVNEAVTLSYNSTTESLDFIFA